MVGARLALAGLVSWALLALPLHAADLSPTADSVGDTRVSFLDDAMFQERPPAPTGDPNHPLEDFFVVGIISLPFTALYSFLGATIADAVNQNRFPPELKTESLITAGGVALGSSLLIATFSVEWGGPRERP